MDLRKALLQAGNQVEEILEGKIGMKATNNVKFRDGLAVAGRGRLERLFEGHRVGAGRVFLASKSTQAARCYADVGWIDMAIDVEVSLVAVHALTHRIRQPTNRKDVRGTIEREGVVWA